MNENFHMPIRRWRSGRVFNRVGAALLLMNIAELVAQTIFMFIEMIFDFNFSDANIVMIISMISQYLIGFPVFFCAISNVPKYEPKEKKSLSFASFIVFLFISIALMFGTNYLNVLYTKIYEILLGVKPYDFLNSTINGFYGLIIFMTVICAPIIEELIFRKLIIERLRVYGDKFAIIISALLFGLLHMNLSQFIYATALGLVLGYVVCYTNEVKYTILIHMIVNILGGAIPLYIERNHMSGMLYEVVILGLILIGFAMLIFYRKRIIFQEPEIDIVTPYSKFFSAPWNIVFFVTCVVSICFILFLPMGFDVITEKKLLNIELLKNFLRIF